MRYHIIELKGAELHNSSMLIINFLNYCASVMGKRISQSAIVSQRNSHMSGYISTENGHIALHGVDTGIFIDIFAFDDFDFEKIKSFMLKHFNVSPDRMTIKTVSELETVECEEPGCIRKATKEWQGRMVCKDHYDYYKEKRARIYLDDPFR